MTYTINENTARQAKEMNSYHDYKPGSATDEYQRSIEEATQIATKQKARIDLMYHDKIDRLLDIYARKLAANMNHSFEIETRMPSILIAVPQNFSARKKEKQNSARRKNIEEWREIQGLLDKIRGTGMGGISADDPNAISKLQDKLTQLEKSQETMKAINTYYYKNKTLDGCPDLTFDQKEKLKANMSRDWRPDPKPYESYSLTNNSANMRRIRSRIDDLEKRKTELASDGWDFPGGKVVMNQQENRVQILFEEKPDEEKRKQLKSNGFRWAPSKKAWQRQLNANGIYAAKIVTGQIKDGSNA